MFVNTYSALLIESLSKNHAVASIIATKNCSKVNKMKDASTKIVKASGKIVLEKRYVVDRTYQTFLQLKSPNTVGNQ